MSHAEPPDPKVQVTREPDFWRTNYLVALRDAMRALREKDQLDLENVLQILPTLREASADPELAGLEAEIRLEAGRHGSERERKRARAAVRWIGGPKPSTAIGGG